MTSKSRPSIFASFVDSVRTVFAALVVIAVVANIMEWASRPPSNPHRSQLWKDVSNAKQIFFGMKMYAGDHNGEFPSKTPKGRAITNSNEALRHLIPDYIPDKRVFYSKGSQWTPKPPDEQHIPGKTPMAGENHFAYTPNLVDTDNQNFPLIATGFAKDSIGTYSRDNQKPGSTSGTFEVVVVRVDGTGEIEQGSTTDFRIYDKFAPNERRDIFKPAPGWLRPDQAPLNPEG